MWQEVHPQVEVSSRGTPASRLALTDQANRRAFPHPDGNMYTEGFRAVHHPHAMAHRAWTTIAGTSATAIGAALGRLNGQRACGPMIDVLQGQREIRLDVGTAHRETWTGTWPPKSAE